MVAKNPMQVISEDEYNEYRAYFMMSHGRRKRMTNEDFNWIDLDDIRGKRS